MLEICIQTSYDQNIQLILKSYLPVVYGTPLSGYSTVVPINEESLRCVRVYRLKYLEIK